MLTFAENFTAMSKNIGFRVAEGVNERFEEFFTNSGKSTKGEAFALLLELTEQTSVNTEELTSQLTGVNAELAEKNRMFTEVRDKLTECKRELTHDKRRIQAFENLLKEKEDIVNMLTEKIELLTSEKQPTISVPPEWEAKAKKVAEINGFSHYHEVLWRLFEMFDGKTYHYDDLKHLSPKEKREIKQSIQND